MNFLDILGTLASVTSVIGFLPQIYKNQRTISVQDLSIWMLFNFFVCSLAWILYGGMTESFYVLLTNVACLCACSVLIGQKLYFQKKILHREEKMENYQSPQLFPFIFLTF